MADRASAAEVLGAKPWKLNNSTELATRAAFESDEFYQLDCADVPWLRHDARPVQSVAGYKVHRHRQTQAIRERRGT